jgi:hypothetical protein
MNGNCDKFLQDYIRVSQQCISLIEHCEIEKSGRSGGWRLTSSSYGNCTQIPSSCVHDIRKNKLQYDQCVGNNH